MNTQTLAIQNQSEESQAKKVKETSDLQKLVLEVKYSEGTNRSVAFRNLVNALKALTWSVVHRCLHGACHHDKEDLVQQIFLRLNDSIGTFDVERSFKNWYITVVKRMCIDEGRKIKRQNRHVVPYDSVTVPLPSNIKGRNFSLLDTLADGHSTPAEDQNLADLIAVVTKSVDENCAEEPLHKKVILMKIVGHTYDEIAKKFGIPLSTGKSIFRRWAKPFRKKLIEMNYLG